MIPSSPRRGIEPRSPAWQAEILTTILPRTCWDSESCTVSWLCDLEEDFVKIQSLWSKNNSFLSPAGNWTSVSRVTGGDTNHYTTEDPLRFWIVHSELIGELGQDFLKIQKIGCKNDSVLSPAGNWTPVSRVTGGDTNHYTTEDLLRFGIVHSELIGDLEEDFVKIQSLWSKNDSVLSPAGNWTPVSRVTSGDTNHYTTEDLLRFGIVHIELISDLEEA